jgi:hypothetical protein
MMSMLMATFCPELVRELRDPFVRNLHLSQI